MDIVNIFISPDSDHISIKSLSVGKAVLFKRIAFPFGKGVDNLRIFVHSFNIKADRALHTVQIIIQTGRRRYKYRSGYAQEIQLLCKCLLKKIFDGFDCHLGIVKIKIRMISGGNFKLFHNNSSSFELRSY